MAKAVKHRSGAPAVSRKSKGSGGGKLALFEVLRAAGEAGPDEDSPVDTAAAPSPAMPSPSEVDRPAAGRSWTVGEPRTAATSDTAQAARTQAARTQRPASTEDGRVVLQRRNGNAEPAGFHVTYGRGVIALGGVAVAILTAFAIGRATAPAPEQADLAVSDIDPSVLDVDGFARDFPETDNPDRTNSVVRTTTPTTGNASAALKPETRTVLSTTPIVQPHVGPRVVGLHYVLMQSYSRSERELADAAIKRLKESGIDATIETGVPGWGSRLAVVGTRSFDRLRDNADYEKYKMSIEAVDRLAQNDKLHRDFDPQAVKWRK